MIQTIEKQKDEIYNNRDVNHSISSKSSNENTPNILKKSPPPKGQVSISPIVSKNDNKQIGNSYLPQEPFINKSADKNIDTNIFDSSHNSNNELKNKKDFVEKKRKRRNKCSYSNNRNKKSKKKLNIDKLNQIMDNINSNGNINCQRMENNLTIDEAKNEGNSNQDGKDMKISNKGQKETNQNTQSNKKRNKNDEKELIANEEKMIMEKINKIYSDEQYNHDLDLNLKERKAQFMKENFPIMYRKDKYYLYTILLKKRRTQPNNFIQPKTLNDSIKESKNFQTLYEIEEPEQIDHVSSQSSDDEKNLKTKEKNISSSKNSHIKQKSQVKNEQKQSMDLEIISPIISNTKNNSKSKKEVEQMKQNLTEPKKPIQEKNKKSSAGSSDTSPSEHDIKNFYINQYNDDIEGQNQDNNFGIKYTKSYNILPKHIWSVPNNKNELNIEMFYDDCIQIWPFNECIFVKEIALEFLMKNEYNSGNCLKHIKEFVSFMKKRALELDISLLNKNEKTVKKYSLRNTKIN